MRRYILILLMVVFVDAKEIYATFNVKPVKEATLAFNATGIVGTFSVDIGSKVQKSEVLAKLDSKDISANVKLSKVALKYAQKDLNRMLKVKSVIDEAKLDKFRFNVESAKAKLEYTNALLNNTLLKAPFNGIITDKYLEVGDAVSGMTLKPVLKIESQHKRKLIIEFDQKYVSSVKSGDSFKYSFDGEKKSYSAKIKKVYPSINRRKRKAIAEAIVEDVPVGLFGTGSIEVK